MRVVLDANIFVSALISSQGNPASIIRRWLDGGFDVLISQAIMDEIGRVTGYERIWRKYAQVRERRLEWLTLLAETGLWVEPKNQLRAIAADDTDNRYLEAAVEGGAQYIVTGDEHLLGIGVYLGIAIVSPATFITLAESGGAVMTIPSL
jgi:putative PIN family toxin of toxin-antitoxin system